MHNIMIIWTCTISTFQQQVSKRVMQLNLILMCFAMKSISDHLHFTGLLMYFIYLEGNHSIKFILSLNISLNTLVVYIDFQESSNYSPHVRPARNLSANF